MRKRFLIFCYSSFIFLLGLSKESFCQNVGIGITAPNTSAQLDITSTAKGLLIPRMNTSSVTSISNPAKGLLVYDSVKNQLMVNMGTASSPNWQTIVSKSGWNLTGNTGNTSNNFLGTADAQPLLFRINNQFAGEIDSANGGQTFLGYGAGKNTTGGSNIAIGYKPLYLNTTGNSNVAIGSGALYTNTGGNNLVAIGDSALFHQSFNIGSNYFNTAIGSKSL